MKTLNDSGEGQPLTREEALLQAGLALTAELSLPLVLQRIVELAVEITGARYGALGVLGADGDELSDFITTGLTEAEYKAIGHLPVGRGILGLLIEDARPLRLTDLGEHPRSVGFPPHHPPMKSFLGAPVMARGQVFGNVYLTEKQGAHHFSEDDERSLVVLASQAGVAVENSRLYEQMVRRERWLEALREVNLAILGDTDQDQVLSLVARRAGELVGADHVDVLTRSETEGVVRVVASEGAHATEMRGLEVPIDGSISGLVIESGLPMTVADATEDPRTYQPMVRLGQMGPTIFVPLRLRGEAFGTLAVSRLVGRSAFSADDTDLVQAFADQASVALEYSRAQRQLRRLVLMDERERIAGELHDGIIQALFGVGMNLQATALRTNQPEVGERIETAVGELDRAIRDLRGYIFGLRPGVLADRRLDEALRDVVDDFEGQSGIPTSAEIDAAVAIELTDWAGEIVQLTREALSNVRRHAEAKSCEVKLRRRVRTAMLEIRDDGRGFDTGDAVGDEHNGLRNMRKRAANMGAELELTSAPGGGTTIRVIIPLEAST